jgi:PKD repeat protein
MRVTKTITLTTQGALTVTVTVDKAKGYVGDTFIFTVNWTPAPSMIPPGCRVDITFGDGTSDSRDGVGPPITFTHSYASAGTKTVTASVKDNYSGATGSKSITVEVASVLTVTFTADKTTGNIPLTVTFTFSMSGGFTPYTWTLDFGDGSPVLSNPTSPQSHTYDKAGSFTATLTVTDALGATALVRARIASTIADWWASLPGISKATIITVAAVSTGGILTLIGRKR